MPEESIEGMVVKAINESNNGKIGPTAVGNLERIGDGVADGAVGKVDADPVSAAQITPFLRCTTVHGSRSFDQESDSALSEKLENLAPKHDAEQLSGFDSPVIISAVGGSLRRPEL